MGTNSGGMPKGCNSEGRVPVTTVALIMLAEVFLAIGESVIVLFELENAEGLHIGKLHSKV